MIIKVFLYLIFGHMQLICCWIYVIRSDVYMCTPTVIFDIAFLDIWNLRFCVGVFWGNRPNYYPVTTPLTVCYPLPEVCQPGQYSNNSISPCNLCPRGTYQPDSAATSCVSCPDGTSTATDGTTNSSQCIGQSTKLELYCHNTWCMCLTCR